MLRQQATAAAAQGRLARNCWEVCGTMQANAKCSCSRVLQDMCLAGKPVRRLPESSISSMVAQLNSCCRVSSASLAIAAMHASSTAASTCTMHAAPAQRATQPNRANGLLG